MAHYAIWVEGQGFLTTSLRGCEVDFTHEPTDALHWPKAIAKLIAEGLQEGEANLDHLRVGLVGWV